MTHPLVHQLHFSRKEFLRCLKGITPEDAVRRIPPMNCISWIIGHLAHQENAYWVYLGQDEVIYPELRQLVGSGKPATTPPLADMQSVWQTVTARADHFLETLTTHQLQDHFSHKGEALEESIGSLLHRNIYHYWFHTGEAHAIRQMLGHPDLPEFVGSMQGYFYRSEDSDNG